MNKFVVRKRGLNSLGEYKNFLVETSLSLESLRSLVRKSEELIGISVSAVRYYDQSQSVRGTLPLRLIVHPTAFLLIDLGVSTTDSPELLQLPYEEFKELFFGWLEDGSASTEELRLFLEAWVVSLERRGICV